jgi:hypothetical protein
MTGVSLGICTQRQVFPVATDVEQVACSAPAGWPNWKGSKRLQREAIATSVERDALPFRLQTYSTLASRRSNDVKCSRVRA